MASQNVLPLKVTLAADSTIPASVMLGSASIDGKSTGATTLYTVPTGKTAIVTKVILRMTAASNVTGVADVSVGKTTAEWEDIVAETTLTNFDAAGETWHFNIASLNASVAAAGTVKIDVDTAATTTGAEDTYTFTAMVFGFLV